MSKHFRSPIVVEPFSFSWFDVEIPDPGPHEAVFRNRACLICGSDLHVYKGLHPMAPLPCCTGHEIAAEVVEVGSAVTEISVGDRVHVSGRYPFPCGQCYHCARGDSRRCVNPHDPLRFEVGGKRVGRFPSGFGEYTMGPAGRTSPIPDNVSNEEAAVTTDLAYVTGVVKRSGAGVGHSAVVIGAGPVGLRTLEAARIAGISPLYVSEPQDYRRLTAEVLGADQVLNPLVGDPVEMVMDLTGGVGVDVVYDTAGNVPATRQGLDMLDTSIGRPATLCLMGLYEHPHDELTFNASDMMRKAGRIHAEWGVRSGGGGAGLALDMMSQGKVHALEWITHRFPEERADEAMMLLIEKRDEAIGVLIVHD